MLEAQRPLSRLRTLRQQLRSPLLLLLIFAAAASGATGEWFDSLIVLVVVFASVAIGYSREYTAQAAADALRARLHSRGRVIRDGIVREIDTRHVVPGDIIELAAGSLVPADAHILDCSDLFVSEAVLTGESFPVEKPPGIGTNPPGRFVDHHGVICGSHRDRQTRVLRTGRETTLAALKVHHVR